MLKYALQAESYYEAIATDMFKCRNNHNAADDYANNNDHACHM